MTLTDEGQKHFSAFMVAVRGIPGYLVARAMNTFTPGVIWVRCSKTHMAEQYAMAKCGSPNAHKRLSKIDLDKLVAICRKEI